MNIEKKNTTFDPKVAESIADRAQKILEEKKTLFGLFKASEQAMDEIKAKDPKFVPTDDLRRAVDQIYVKKYMW